MLIKIKIIFCYLQISNMNYNAFFFYFICFLLKNEPCISRNRTVSYFYLFICLLEMFLILIVFCLYHCLN